MLNQVLGLILIREFILYERITARMFFKMCADAGFIPEEATSLWDRFDTTSAPAIKSLVRIAEREYGIPWQDFKDDTRKTERATRRVRSDIIHAKKDYSAARLRAAIRAVRGLRRLKERRVLRPVLHNAPENIISLRLFLKALLDSK